MFDSKITNGKIIDGSGGKPFIANIGIRNGVITEIGECHADAKQTIDAKGAIVTPGFIDIHTHYDGQVSWDDELKPSVNHGVTTAVLGNCGVGFAPCRNSQRDTLVKLMEGVEDIPGTALYEGIQWNWETFPEYMDAIEQQPHSIDIAVLVPHDPLRVYVMGERAVHDQSATEQDIETMHQLVLEAMQAGAIGVSTGRSDVHQSSDGQWTPASEASRDELVGIASALAKLDYGVLQAVNDFDMIRPEDNFDKEFELMQAFFTASNGKPCSISLMQRDFAPDDWRKIIERSEQLNKQGQNIHFQVAPRAIGVFNGLNCSFHPLMAFPCYIAIADKSLEERVAIMKTAAFKQQMLSEKPVPLSIDGSGISPVVDVMISQFEMMAEKIFKLGQGYAINYEQSNETSIAAQARQQGISVWEKTLELLVEDDGHAMLYFPVYNYTEMNFNNIYTMLTHPKSLPGLSDGGAHVGTICDASFSTYLLSYWTRDRAKHSDKHICLSRAIQMLSADCADYLGLKDRGRLAVGLKADINIIDYDNLALGVPVMVNDLPNNSQRLLQPVKGYKATLVSGEQIIDNDNLLTARPGKLVRMSA